MSATPQLPSPNNGNSLQRKALSAINLKSLLILVAAGALITLTAGLINKALKAQRHRQLVEQSDTNGFPADYPRMNEPAPDFRLMDQNSKQVGLSDLNGRVVLVTFAFAHCQTMCPLIVQQTLAAAQQSTTKKLSVLFVTLDPERDRPETLSALAEKWRIPPPSENLQISILSGTTSEVNRVLDAYRIPRQLDRNSGEILHPALSYIIDRNGRFAYQLNHATVDWLVEAISRVDQP